MKLPETRRLRIGMAQINATVGDFTGNKRKIIKVIGDAKTSGVDILTFPELAICGYPPEDLLFKPSSSLITCVPWMISSKPLRESAQSSVL